MAKVGNLPDQCFAKSPFKFHKSPFFYWPFARLMQGVNTEDCKNLPTWWTRLTSECTKKQLSSYEKDHFKAKPWNWESKVHLKTSACFLSWNDYNIDFLMTLIRVEKKKERPNMGSNDKWDKQQNIVWTPPNDFTKSQIRRSDHIFSRKSQSIAIYSCLREFSPNGSASLLQGKWPRNGSLLQLY